MKYRSISGEALRAEAGLMVSSSENEEILKGAVSGIARVALAIAAIPTEHRKQALQAAERSYLQTTIALGYGEAAARKWVSAVMLRLRVEVEDVGSGVRRFTPSRIPEITRLSATKRKVPTALEWPRGAD